MKKCCKCHEVKPLTEFNKREASKDGYQPRCKSCHALHNKKHYQENKAIYIKRAIDSKHRLREWFIQIKSQLQCEHCGEDKYWRLDFHHPNPSGKEENLAAMVSGSYSKEKILCEINKCQTLCRNCHADVHYEERFAVRSG